MKIVIKSFDEKCLEDRDYRDAYEIKIDGKGVFSVWDGEPEDANLARDFCDVYSIPDLMRKAWEAGKAGEELVFSEEAIEE